MVSEHSLWCWVCCVFTFSFYCIIVLSYACFLSSFSSSDFFFYIFINNWDFEVAMNNAQRIANHTVHAPSLKLRKSLLWTIKTLFSINKNASSNPRLYFLSSFCSCFLVLFHMKWNFRSLCLSLRLHAFMTESFRLKKTTETGISTSAWRRISLTIPLLHNEAHNHTK